MKSPIFSKTYRLVLIMFIAFLIMDLWPHWGSPDFRYTGVNPDRSVANLGWPVALAIYDHNVSPHVFVGPMTLLLLPCQGFLLLILSAAIWTWTKVRTKTDKSCDCRVE